MSKFSNNSFDVSIINSFGEFKTFETNSNLKYFKMVSLLKKDYSKIFSDKGFILSRLSWFLIVIITFVPLLKLIKKDKPDYLVIHLLTILPLIINYFFNLNTKIILRISGFPKLNFFRKFLWKIMLPKVYAITCPTIGTKEYILSQNFISPEKVFYLADPIIEINKLNKNIEKTNNYKTKFKRYIFSAGRLTKQKNYNFLINCFSDLEKNIDDLKLVIAGDGEEKENLNKLIKKLNLNNKVEMIGYSNDVFSLMKNSLCFVSSSLWEDPGFVLVEAIACRTPVISSSCKNGPQEILLKGRGGYLYKTNDKRDFIEKFNEFYEDLNNSPDNLFQKKLEAFKNVKIYSKYSHYKSFSKIIQNNCFL